MNLRFIERDGKRILQQEVQDVAFGWTYKDVPIVVEKPKEVMITRVSLSKAWVKATGITATYALGFENVCKELGL